MRRYFFYSSVIHRERRVGRFNGFLLAMNDSVLIALNITSHVWPKT